MWVVTTVPGGGPQGGAIRNPSGWVRLPCMVMLPFAKPPSIRMTLNWHPPLPTQNWLQVPVAAS